MKVRVKALIKIQYLFGQRCVYTSIAIHCNSLMMISEMKVWLEEEGEGMRMKRGELEMARESQQEEEEHVLISVMASVMIYQVLQGN